MFTFHNLCDVYILVYEKGVNKILPWWKRFLSKVGELEIRREGSLFSELSYLPFGALFYFFITWTDFLAFGNREIKVCS